MANEATCIETPTKFARYTVDDTVAVPIGTILKLSGANYASKSSSNDIFAGIAWEEKTASDGLTEITAAINGIWDVTVSTTTVTNGGIVSLSGANVVKQAVEAEMVTGAAFGKCLETGTASAATRVRLGLV